MADKYKITSQQQEEEINPSGLGFVQVWRVAYVVTSGPAKGTRGSVTLPAEDHNAQQVDQAISAKVADLSSIASLGG